MLLLTRMPDLYLLSSANVSIARIELNDLRLWKLFLIVLGIRWYNELVQKCFASFMIWNVRTRIRFARTSIKNR